MSKESEKLSEADEIAALFPWYVTGKLSAADKARVDAYTTAHPEVLRHIELARDEADVVFAENQKIAAPRGALDRLKADLASSPRVRLFGAKASVIDKFGGWLAALTPRQLGYAGLAAAAAIALQVASLPALMRGGGAYRVASDQNAGVQSGTVALVSFQPAAPAATISAFLSDNGYAIVDGPLAGGLYRLRISAKMLTTVESDAALAKLKGRADVIAFASIAPVKP